MTHRTVCPFFQGKDERCARRFNLQCLPEVFSQCLDDYAACPIYARLRDGQPVAAPERDAVAAA